jgi:hypothetical protein
MRRAESRLTGVLAFLGIVGVLSAGVAGYALELSDPVDRLPGVAGVEISQTTQPDGSETVTVMLTASTNADYVLVRSSAGAYTSGDRIDHDGDGLVENDVDGIGEAVRVTDLSAGDRVQVLVGSGDDVRLVRSYTVG